LLVREFMDRDLTSVGPECTLGEAVEVMNRHRLSGLPVVDEEGRLLGYISESDVIRAAMPGYVDHLKSLSFVPDVGQLFRRLRRLSREPVSSFMTREVVAFEEDDHDMQVALEMLRRGLKRAPVVREGKLVGVVSRADLLERIMLEGLEVDG